MASNISSSKHACAQCTSTLAQACVHDGALVSRPILIRFGT